MICGKLRKTMIHKIRRCRETYRGKKVKVLESEQEVKRENGKRKAKEG